ncbi:MAG: DEAD/DEAH box helicase, partial [SAR202 cluster bacterium]|nr:DEAD/DEAH box helicase [SAR202 cluster bacterium]
MPSFQDLNLSPTTLSALEEMGFTEPTPVQLRAVPPMLQGRDVIAQAQTGTGKTAAFGIPIVERVDGGLRKVQALVLAPTRELAMQISTQLAAIGKHMGISVVTVYGGQSYETQIRAIKRGPQVVVATPGRLIDLLDQKIFALDALKMLVLDEADEMLNMGFLEEVETILKQMPSDRQTALFSATMPQDIVRLSAAYMRDPKRVILSRSGDATSVATVEHRFYEVLPEHKVEALFRLLDTEHIQLGMVFCNTRVMAAELADEVQARGYRALALHGEMTQAHRETVMRATRGGQIKILVATDVAARGIDIPEVSHVINFDPPMKPEDYVNRIGRTGRAGRTGVALNLITPRQYGYLRAIESITRSPMARREIPSVSEAMEFERAAIADSLEEILQTDAWKDYRAVIRRLTNDYDPFDVAAAALAHGLGPVKHRVEIPAPPRPEPRRSTRPQGGASRGGPGPRRNSASRGAPDRPYSRPAGGAKGR